MSFVSPAEELISKAKDLTAWIEFLDKKDKRYKPIETPNSDLFHATLHLAGIDGTLSLADIDTTLTPADDDTTTPPTKYRVLVKRYRRGDVSEDAASASERALAKELGLLHLFKHPHVNRILGKCVKKDVVCVVTPWVKGGNLWRWLETDRTEAMCRQMLRGITLGLFHLHDSDPQILHGDIHPANVLIGPDQRALLADFGLSKVALNGGIYSITNGWGRRSGVQAYLAPELNNRKVPRSEATDVFAFGCLAWAIFTREPPFGDSVTSAQGNLLQVLEQHAERSSIPGDLFEMITACLSKDPSGRPSMRDIVRIVDPNFVLPPLKPGQRGENPITLSQLDTIAEEEPPEAPSPEAPSPPQSLITGLEEVKAPASQRSWWSWWKTLA